MTDDLRKDGSRTIDGLIERLKYIAADPLACNASAVSETAELAYERIRTLAAERDELKRRERIRSANLYLRGDQEAERDVLQTRLLKAIEVVKGLLREPGPLPDLATYYGLDPLSEDYCVAGVSSSRGGCTIKGWHFRRAAEQVAELYALLQSIEAESGGDEPSLRPSGEAEGLLTKNPAPNASPIAAPTGRYAEFTVSAHPTPGKEAE